MATIDLKHTITHVSNKLKMYVNIRLNDECNNGHADFAITCMAYEKSRNGRWIESFGGCAHDEILKLYPSLQPFVDLHLSDSNGIPMYAVENGFYLLWNGDNTSEQRKQIVKKYLRINDQEVDQIADTQDIEYFKQTVESLGLLDRWDKEAKAAIKQLETLTGQEWDHQYQWDRTN